MSLIFVIIALLMLWKGGPEAAILAWPMLIISGIFLIIRIKENADFEAKIANSQMTREIEEGQRRSAQLVQDALDSKVCPFCAETIKKAAKKCKHCGEAIEDDPNSTQEEVIVAAQSQPDAISVVEEVVTKPADAAGVSSKGEVESEAPKEAPWYDKWYYVVIIAAIAAAIKGMMG